MSQGNQNNNSNNNLSTTPLNKLPLAMAYVPMESWETPYNAASALMQGTVFPSLVLPFEGRTGGKRQ